ncbi:MAG: hypothetical protein ACRCSF_01885 [Mycobacteriaceae bacterium]
MARFAESSPVSDSPVPIVPRAALLFTLLSVALSAIVVAFAAVVLVVDRRQETINTASASSEAATLALLQSLSSHQGEALQAQKPKETVNAPVSTIPTQKSSQNSLPASTLSTTETTAPITETSSPPSAIELTHILRLAVDPSRPLSQRQANVENGQKIPELLGKISERAGIFLSIVNPQVIDPIDFNENQASGRLQVTFNGSAGPETPLRLTWKHLDGQWKLSARSICDIASFNGFSCPSDYAVQ